MANNSLIKWQIIHLFNIEQNIKQWRISLWWLIKLYARTLEILENMEKLEILVWEDGTFCDHLWSAIMLSAILDANHNQNQKW